MSGAQHSSLNRYTVAPLHRSSAQNDSTIQRFNDSTAFTLLEILIAVAICSIVLAAINGVFYAALRLRSRASKAVEDLTPVEHAVSIMKRDLVAAIPPGGTFAGPMTTTPTTFGIMPQGNVLEFFSGSGLISDDVPWGDVQKVDFYLKAPLYRTTGTGKDLVRAVTRNLLSTAQEQPEEQLLLEDVDQLQFSFFDGSQWRQVWDSSSTTTTMPGTTPASTSTATTSTGTNQAAMPLAVQVMIQPAAAEGKVRSPIQFVVPISTTRLATVTQTNSP